jgi:hypothetical protein
LLKKHIDFEKVNKNCFENVNKNCRRKAQKMLGARLADGLTRLNPKGQPSKATPG